MTANLPHQIYGKFLVWYDLNKRETQNTKTHKITKKIHKNLPKETYQRKTQKLTKISGGKRWSDRPLLFYQEKFNQIDS